MVVWQAGAVPTLEPLSEDIATLLLLISADSGWCRWVRKWDLIGAVLSSPLYFPKG